jgi:hypothetical protein
VESREAGTKSQTNERRNKKTVEDVSEFSGTVAIVEVYEANSGMGNFLWLATGELLSS